MDDPVALSADAVARWHASWLTALGLHSVRDAEAWRALEKPPLIYFAGITLCPDVQADTIAGVPGSICDAWQTLDLAPAGFRVWRKEPWFYRAPGPLLDTTPPELDIVAVSTPEEVYEEERRIQHNIRALVNSIRNRISPESRPYVHLFATSADIMDTARALCLTELTRNVLVPDLAALLRQLIELARRHANPRG